MIHFSCACGTRLKAADAFAGQAAHCPTCGTTLEVPQPGPEVPVAAPPTANGGGPPATEPYGRSRAPSRLAKAELFRRTRGQCVRCRTRLNLATAQFRLRPSQTTHGGPCAADWEVLCLSCLEEVRNLAASPS
jgi:hypothetical protein